MNQDMPDYESYSLGDLFQARDSINRDEYPERLAEIETLIYRKINEPETKEAKLERIASKYHTFWQRFFALLVDFIALVILYLAILKLLQALGWWTIPVALVFQYFYFLSYSVICHGLYGKTLGKLATGIVVRDAKAEQSIGFKHALLRDSVPLVIALIVFITVLFAYVEGGYLTKAQQNLIVWVGSFQGIWFLLELITMLLNSKRRALHDFIGGTVVVRE